MSTISLFNKQVSAVDSLTVHLNKGHFNLDSEERSAAFSHKMALGWEEGYAQYRGDWERLPRERMVRDYPLLVDLELASSCNLKCPMCYTTTQHFKENVKRTMMDWDLFVRVIDEISGKVPAVRLSWRGESTLYKRFVEAVSYAKSKGVGEVSFLTNGSTLDLPFFIRLVEAGADWITVSFDGLEEEYNRIRSPLKYEETLNKLRAAMEYKAQHGLARPLIKVQGVWPAIRKDPQSYYETLKQVSDLVAFNPLIDYLGNDDEEMIVYEENFSCPQLYQRLTISSTGLVVMCSNDEYGEEILGDIRHQTVHAVWNGDKIKRIREIHGKNYGFKLIPKCKLCYYPRKNEVTEEVVVDQRRILIKNYINRAQTVGS